MYLDSFAPDASIVAACVVIGWILKWFFEGNERNMAGIPWMLAVFGAVMGALQGIFIPSDIPLNIYSAIAQGAVSGLAACGCYQAVHQQMKLNQAQKLEAEMEELEETTGEQMSKVLSFDEYNDLIERLTLGGPFVEHLLDTVLNKDKSSDSDEDEE